MNGIPKVFVVDDDQSYLTAVSRLLRLKGFEVRTFDSAERFLEELTPVARGCVLADLSLPGMSGFELQQCLLSSPASMPIVFLTGQGDIAGSVRAMRLGAVDFLEKRASAENLVDAIKAALNREEAEFGTRRRRDQQRARFSSLSPRELEVLKHVVDGRMNKEIAAALDIHERTVKLHRTAITRKVGVQSAALLATLVRETELFESIDIPDRPESRQPAGATFP